MLIIKALLVLCSAAVVLAQGGGKAVVSGAIFVGEDTTDPSAAPADIFREAKNHASAVSSVLVYSAERANFHPSTQPSKSLESLFGAFIEKVSTFPGFLLERNEIAGFTLNGSLFQFEEVIRGPNPDYHQALLARNLRDLVPGYIVNRDEKEWILSLIIIDKPQDEDIVEFSLVQVTLSIGTDKENTAIIIPNQVAELSTSVFRVIDTVLKTNADRLGEMIPITKVRDALDFFNSPKVEEVDDLTFSAAPCYKKPAVFVNQGQRALYNWQTF